jgi:hypothetical protein
MATTPADELKGFDTSKLETEDDDSGESAFPSLRNHIILEPTRR